MTDAARRLAGMSFAPLVVAATLAAPGAQSAAVVVDGDVGRRLALSLDDLRAMGHQRVGIEQQGQRAVYEGVPLVEVLRQAGVAIGRAPLQGRTLGSVAVVTGSDGFRAIFALAELDPASRDLRVILADARDGRPLPGGEGPIRLIAPGDTYPARWIRGVVRITVTYVDLP